MKTRQKLVPILLSAWLAPQLVHGDPNFRMTVKGLAGAPLENVQNLLNAGESRLLQQKQFQTGEKHPTLTPADMQTLRSKAPGEILRALQPYGYFRATVSEGGMHCKKNICETLFLVSKGVALPVAGVKVTISGEGKNNPALVDLLRHFPLNAGDTFSIPEYDRARETLLQTAAQQGYLRAVIDKKTIHINRKSYTAVISLHLDTGSRYYFGPVSFSQTSFSPEFLQRFVSIKTGEPFSSDKLLLMQEALSKSHYFSQVTVTPLNDKAMGRHVPIQILLKPRKAKAYTLGLGYGTFTGPRATLGADYRHIGHTGQHFSLQMRLSSVLSGLAAKYYFPGNNPLTEQFVLGAEAQKFSPDNGESTSQKFSASWLKTCDDWQHALNLTYLIEHYKIDETPSEISRLFYPGYSVTWRKLDDLLQPSDAKAFSFNIQGANTQFISHVSFLQAELRGKYLFSPFSGSHIILRADAGYTVVRDLSLLPLTLRFFAGGISSVRGYPDSSLGPGRYLETASVEYQHHLTGKLSGAIFYDVGNATNHFNDVLFRGSGVGLIYDSPIGPVRIYVARALSKPGKPFRTEFSIGPDF